MGKDLADRFELARNRYMEAAEILGFNLARICFEGPEDDLRQTRVTQPALYVHSCIVAELLAEWGVVPSAAAGHSLGEYSALAAAGAFTFGDGLKLVKARAEAMQEAGEMNPGTMAAIVGLSDEQTRELCQEAGSEGIVVPANFNSPGQVVISGSVVAVRKAISLAASKGAKLAKELNVSGAFHSPLMQPAADSLRLALAGVPLSAPRFPVVSNVTAEPHTDVERMRELLSRQLLSPVRWTECLLALSSMGCEQWYEVGSGNVLSGLLKRTVKGASAKTIGKLEDFDKLLNE
jgi:[acyl-carrier-protein] S-malonyltransferase